MIEVEYDREKTRLKVTGHADYSEKGTDIVCAAVSQTVYIYACAVMQMAELELGQKPKIELEAGNSEVVFKPYKENKNLVAFALDNVAVGFTILAKNYPERVLLKLVK